MRTGLCNEYDMVLLNVAQSLETKKISGSFTAGKIMERSQEEAAGQGIIAGINAALKSKENRTHFERSDGY